MYQMSNDNIHGFREIKKIKAQQCRKISKKQTSNKERQDCQEGGGFTIFLPFFCITYMYW